MRNIRRIAVYRVDLALHEVSCKWSGGNSVAVYDSLIVEVEADDGTIGHGEIAHSIRRDVLGQPVVEVS